MKRVILTLLAILTTSSLLALPKAIVFDFGGVMTGENNREAVVDFIRESFHLTKAEFEKINQQKRSAIKQGKTDEEFWVSYAETKGIILPEDWRASFKKVMKQAIGINPSMYALVEELRNLDIPVALLSNIDERLAKLLREYGLYAPFDPCILSYEIGIDKPDPRAYEFLLNKLQFTADEVVFIDDKKENVEAAKKLSIDAILFKSEPQLREELIQRDVLIRSP